MKFENLKKKNRKIFFYCLIVGAVLIITLFSNTSLAKYKTTKSINIVKGSINYSVADWNVLAIKIENENGEYENSDSVPSSGYVLDKTESYCEVNGVKDSSVTITYDDGVANVGFTKKGTKCYLYFAIPELGGNYIIADKIISTRSDFSAILTTDTTGTIYSAEDDDGTSYYYAGAPTDNWVKFGGYYWRIIRINGDGTIRLIYSGNDESGPVTTGENTQIGTSQFNSKTGDNMYVGYMYTSGNVHGVGTSSTIKGILDNWYASNLASNASYIDVDAGFCGDRLSSTSTTSINESGGTGTTKTYYGAYIRLVTNKTPDLKCAVSDDLYTINSSLKGNKALTYPIGLITADEISYAGGVWVTQNVNYYLNTGYVYHTMSPYYLRTSSDIQVFAEEEGYLSAWAVSVSNGVRPVINLRADVTLTGSGTSIDPYQVALE